MGLLFYGDSDLLNWMSIFDCESPIHNFWIDSLLSSLLVNILDASGGLCVAPVSP
jgi:hypothetical protein